MTNNLEIVEHSASFSNSLLDISTRNSVCPSNTTGLKTKLIIISIFLDSPPLQSYQGYSIITILPGIAITASGVNVHCPTQFSSVSLSLQPLVLLQLLLLCFSPSLTSPRLVQTSNNRSVFPSMFIVALFTIAKFWK